MEKKVEVHTRLHNWWPLILCVFAYFLSVGWVGYSSAKTTGCELVYPLDDTYIHMSIAKNFSQYGVWGFTNYAFSSTTSSPLYTGILAAINFICGPHILIPLAINLLIGTILIFYFYKQFREVSVPFVGLLLLVICFAISIPALTLLGMEHLLHTLLTLLFFHLGSMILAYKKEGVWQSHSFLLLAALLPLTRYEGIFIIAVFSACLVLQKRFRIALTLVAAGLLPILLYGLLCRMQGWFVIPNSIILKGNVPHLSTIIGVLEACGLRSIRFLYQVPLLLILFIMSIITCRLNRGDESQEVSPICWNSFAFLGVMLVHLQFAQAGWLYRYEAYLVGLWFATIFPSLVRLIFNALSSRLRTPQTAILMVGILVFAYPFAERGYFSLALTKKAMHDRFLEHIQPTRFLNEYFPNSTVVVNDIGAVSYFTKCRLLDMYGLGNIEPLRFRLSKSGYTKTNVDEWTKSMDADLALLQVEWVEVKSRIPDSWIKVAEWQIPRNVVFGDRRIGWFAVKQEMADTLASALIGFQDRMPKDIKVKIMQKF